MWIVEIAAFRYHYIFIFMANSNNIFVALKNSNE